jgi:mediator of RNA polymerase II transcription subunit 13
MLAAPPPTALEFTDSFPVQHRSLLRDNSSLHIAYSVSSDNRWVTAVWTDDWGQVSLKESYCLSRLLPSGGGLGKVQPIQSFESVCAQIWRRTVEIAKQARINWKVVIVREGGMSKQEVGIWNNLNDANGFDLAGRIQLILACVDLHPPLAVSVLNTGAAAASPVATISTPFPSSVATFSQSSPAAMGNAYGTPVATPLAQANESPDPSGGIMSTPGGTATSDNVTDFDSDVRWLDASDEVWGIVLNHRVPASTRSEADKETRFSLASGYLWPIKSNDSHNLIQVALLLAAL